LTEHYAPEKSKLSKKLSRGLEAERYSQYHGFFGLVLLPGSHALISNSLNTMHTKAEIIAVGTELLLGEVVNTNAQFLAQELATLGIHHHFQMVVGDNPNRIKQVLAIACQRSNLVLLSGGLGPTPDDLTTATLADFFETPLVESPEIWADIQSKFKARGLVASPSNRKQAWLPEGATVLPNPIGSAPGMIWQPHPNLILVTFPGVPKELHAMWHETVRPYLQAIGWTQAQIYQRILRFWGIAESTLSDALAPFFTLSSPTVAPYVSEGEVRLRLAVQAESQAVADGILQPVAEQIRAQMGMDCYGQDGDSLASVVGDLLRSRSETVSVAESCTGGGLGHRLTTLSGSSDYFQGGVIAYANAVKVNLLGVDPAILEQEGAVSAPVAQQMALGVRDRLQTTWGISVTGIAGPTGDTPDKPLGLVYIAIAGPQGVAVTQEFQLGSARGRDWVRQVSVSHALDQLRRHLLQIHKP
jgi:nicotinamide-nucleotide amidase